MEAKWRWALVTAVAPLAWGSTYFVTRHFLPGDAPFWGAALRALPAGLLLLPLVRRLPRGSQWWRAALLAVLNFGAFFPLVYLAAQLLPSSIAASIMALSPFVLGGLALPLLGQRIGGVFLLTAACGVAGVILVVGSAGGAIDGWGVVVSLVALLTFSLGSILATRWAVDIPLLASTCWQLLAAGLMLLVAAVCVEGAPPEMTGGRVAAYSYVAVIAGALSFVCWFTGLRRLPAGTVGLIGLLNPVAGIALGVLFAGEVLSPWQVVGAVLVLVAIGFGSRGRRAGSPKGAPEPSSGAETNP